MKKGDKVTYQTPYKTEKGIVKEIVSDTKVRVVFNCGGNWEDYKDYTSVLCNVSDLKKDW